MTKQIFVCDRCGAEVEKSVLETYINKPSVLVNYNILFPKSYDLCPKCKDELKEFMKNENNRNE